MHRVGDVEGWQIPGRYLEFLRGGPAEAARRGRPPQRPGRAVAGLAARPHRAPAGRPGGAVPWPRPATWPVWPARSPGSDGCPRRSTVSTPPRTGRTRCGRRIRRRAARPARHVACRRPGDARGRTLVVAEATGRLRRTADTARPAVAVRVRQRAGRRRLDDGADRRRSRPPPAPPRRGTRTRSEAWSALAAGPGRTAVVAAIELAKIHEHRRHDPSAALAAANRGLGAIERRRRLGRPEPALEADLLRRVARLRHPQARGARGSRAARPASGTRRSRLLDAVGFAPKG